MTPSIEWADRQPSALAGILFLLLFSGPPMFRHRSATASLRGEIDAVIIFHVIVWAVAGCWIFYQMRFYFQENSKPLGFHLPQKLGLGLIAVLGMSTFVSVAPSLTAFMVYQMFISLMFTTIFVDRYGVEACLRKLFQASAILCVVIAVAAFTAPDLVMVVSETGAPRVRGDLLGGTEGFATFCLVLLLAGVQKTSKIAYGLLLGLSCTLLLASLSRTAYLVLFVIILLVFFKRRSSKPFRRFAYISAFAIVPLVTLSSVFDLSQYRNPEGMWTLSDRLGLWTYLYDTTLQKSPWLGLGYYAGGRAYGLEYNPELATPHSMYLEIFVGGGLLASIIFITLCVVVSAYLIGVFRQNTNLSFTVTVLFLATLMFGSVGGTVDSGLLGITFWSIAASLPILRTRSIVSARAAMVPKGQLMKAR